MKCMQMISRERDHSERRGVGVNGRLEPFQKFIRFGTMTRPLESFTKRHFSNLFGFQTGHSIFEIDPGL